ncbi:unnamed protein product [Caenorhabditis nigoni]
MAKLIDTKSTPCATANICLFDTPPSQVAFSKGKWMTFSPSNPIEPKGPYTFNVFDSAHFFQLNRTYLTFKAHLSSVKKKEEGGVKASVHVSHTNFIGATFFNQVKLSYNNVLVYDSSHYAYKAYINTLLGESDEMKEGFLSAARWSNDEEALDSVTTDKRRIQEDGATGLDLCTPLLLEPFQTDKLLIPHINIQLTLYRNNDAFCLESTEADNPAKLYISDLKLHMRAIDVVPSAAIALENRLRTTPAQYPFKNSKVKIITIPEGRTELPFNVLYQDILPRRVIVGLIEPEAMEGSFTKNCFNFAHHNLSEIQLDAGGTVYPPQPIQCDFSNKNYAQAFTRMYEELGALSDKASPRITYKMFRNGFAFYVFNLSAVDAPNSWELIQSGTTQLYIRFKEKTPKGGLNALVLSEYDGMITIDSFRNTTVTHMH